MREALQYSAFRFGATVMARYTDLIARALVDISADPLGIGSHERPNLGQGIRSRHLKTSNTGSGPSDPRHIVFYRVDGDRVLVLRLLHEARDLAGKTQE